MLYICDYFNIILFYFKISNWTTWFGVFV